MNLRVFFLIVSGVIGSGIFFIPYNLHTLGVNSFISLFVISILFAYIGSLFGKTRDSIFKQIDTQFGNEVGFFTAWIYWIIAWSSTIVVIVEMYRYFINIFPFFADYQSSTQIVFVVMCVTLNLFRNKYQGFVEILVNTLKIAPLAIIPFFVVKSPVFKISNILLNQKISLFTIFQGLPKIVWCFLGIECGSMINEKKDLLKTIVASIFFISIIYFLNLLCCFGVLSYNFDTFTPFASMMNQVFGETVYMFCNILVFLVTLGALNSWIISGSAVALESSKIGYFPKILQTKNRFNSEYYSLILSSIGLIPLCFMSTSSVLIEGVDLASNNVLLFYAIFVSAYGLKNKSRFAMFVGLICFVIFSYFISMVSLLILFALIVLGLPLYLKQKNQIKFD